MPGVFFVSIYFLAFARVVRLAVSDKIFEGPRNRVVIFLADRDRTMLAYLITCPWCFSIWLGAVAAPMIYFWGRSPWLLVPALALALSMVTGLLATAEGD